MTEDGLRDVRRAVWDIRRKWFDLGIELGIPLSVLSTIRDQYRDTFSDCLTQMLSEWLKRRSPPPTWRALAAALREPVIDEEALADKIKTEHRL